METLLFSKFQNSMTELVTTYREVYRRTMLAELPDMTFRQFVYLDAIMRMDSPTYSEVAKKFEITKPAVTAIVNKLISLGYIKRIQSKEDRRIHHLLVNEKAKKILGVETKAAAEYVKSIQNSLTKEEQEQFISIVEKIMTSYKLKKD